MKTLLKIDARKAILTAAVAAAFISANPLVMNGSVFGGVANASQRVTGHATDNTPSVAGRDMGDSAMARLTNQTASAAGSSYVAPAIADNDMDGDNGLSNSDRRDESHFCKGRACR